MPRHKQATAPIHSPPLRPLRLVGKYFPELPLPPAKKSYTRPPHDHTTPTASSRARDIRSSPVPSSPSRHRQSAASLAPAQISLPNGYTPPCRPSLSKRSSTVSLRQSVSPSPTPRRTLRPSTTQALLGAVSTPASRPMYNITNASTGHLGAHSDTPQRLESRLPVRKVRSSLHLASTAASRAHQGNLLVSPGKHEFQSRQISHMSLSPTPPASRSRYRAGSVTPAFG